MTHPCTSAKATAEVGVKSGDSCTDFSSSSAVYRRLLAIFASLFLAAQSYASPTVGFQTVDSFFVPEITLDTNSATFLWTWSDSTVSIEYPIASNILASPGLQWLTVSPPSALTSINLGFDGGDDGWTNQFSMRDQQGVASITFTAPLSNLQLFAASHNPLTNVLDFSGFNSLQDIECFDCTNVQHVIVTNLPSLRRICFEDNNLQELDLSGNYNLEDVRGALNAFTEIKFDSAVGPKVWHWCFRNSPNMTQQFNDVLTNFYSLREPWFWQANQRGALSFVSSNLTDVEVWGNQYEFADFSNQSNMFECLVSDNILTNLLINNCKSLQILDARNNSLPTCVLDSILVFLDSSAHDSSTHAIQILDLTHNDEFPSSSGLSHYSHLTNRFRNAAIDVDFPDPNASQITYTIQTDPPGRAFTVDGKTFSSAQAFHWPAGSTHSISTTSTQSSGSDSQYVWTDWDDSGAVSHLVAPKYDTIRTAHFVTRYFLRITSGAGGTVSPSSGWYDAGSVLPLTAIPNPGFSLVSWTGGGSGSYSGSVNPTTVTMNGPISESAAFSLNMDTLALNISGQGTVIPNYNGQSLQIGKPFKITAKPAPGFVLSNWCGGVFPQSTTLTNSAKLNFVMQSNLVLQANFVSNPFLPLKGSYSGLFGDSAGAQHASSGLLAMTLTDRGTYSGSIIIGGARSSISGQFDLSGGSTNVLTVGPNSITVVLVLEVSSGANLLTGTVTANNWQSDVRAFRAVFDSHTNPPAQFASKYTVVIPGTPDDPAKPAGDGWATLSLNSSGSLTISGTLADGTSFRQTGPISQQGDFPLYVALSSGGGSVFGWLSITNRDRDDLHGQLTWTKAPLSSAKFYPLGFTNTNISAVGSIYTPPPPGTRALNLTDGFIAFSGGNLSSFFTNIVTLGTNNKLTSSANPLSMVISTASGQLGGTVTAPGSTKALPTRGVVLQKQNLASGFVLVTNQSSKFVLSP